MSTITDRIRSVVSEVVRNNISVHERWISDEQWLSILAITSELVTNKRAFNRALNDCTTINSVIGTKKRRHSSADEYSIELHYCCKQIRLKDKKIYSKFYYVATGDKLHHFLVCFLTTYHHYHSVRRIAVCLLKNHPHTVVGRVFPYHSD